MSNWHLEKKTSLQKILSSSWDSLCWLDCSCHRCCFRTNISRIPPWLLWLFSPESLVSKFNDMPFRRAHGVEDLIMNIWELKYILKIVLNMLINPITIEGENCRFVFKHHGACWPYWSMMVPRTALLKGCNDNNVVQHFKLERSSKT